MPAVKLGAKSPTGGGIFIAESPLPDPTYPPPDAPAPVPPALAPALGLGLDMVILIVAGDVEVTSTVANLSIVRR